MRRAAPMLGAAALLLAGCGGAREAGTPAAATATPTATVSRPADHGGLPAAVAEKRAAILAAAESGDYAKLRPLLADGFRYTFGDQVRGGAIAHWRKLEQTTDESPIKTLAAIMKMPYTLTMGNYFWPFAFSVPPDQLSPYERMLLKPIAGRMEIEDWKSFGAYFDWRAGIRPNGDWNVFIAGD